MEFRIEKDSMGEVKVPKHAYYRAQTQRAVENFPISFQPLKPALIRALGRVKQVAALVNRDLELLPPVEASYIARAAQEIAEGKHLEHFPIDIFQTGSGTSSNMNANEVVATRAEQLAASEGKSLKIHPNDHVNFGQSSNDAFPTAVRLAISEVLHQEFIPALQELHEALMTQAKKYDRVVKTGKTHLMDAMPVTFGQVFSGYARQIQLGVERLQATVARLHELPQGGTAVGTGINTHPEFGARFAQKVSELTGWSYTEAQHHFEAQSTMDAPCEVSAMVKTVACSIMKIANDFRWMNSGPFSGISEISIQPLQPGSSIMPGKVNPVVEESTTMVCAQVIGNDVAATIAAQSGNFELNVMMPVMAQNVLSSLELLANAARNFARLSVSQVKINEAKIAQQLHKNPILVTALNPLIGYDLAAKIAKTSYATDRSLLDVAKEMTTLSEAELRSALDPIKMTKGGMHE